jgi:hypothetical protein
MTQIFDLQSDGIDTDALSGDFARGTLSESKHASLGDTMIGGIPHWPSTLAALTIEPPACEFDVHGVLPLEVADMTHWFLLYISTQRLLYCRLLYMKEVVRYDSCKVGASIELYTGFS